MADAAVGLRTLDEGVDAVPPLVGERDVVVDARRGPCARRVEVGREPTPSMVVVDSHMARGASQGGPTFHDRGGKFRSMKGAKRVVTVDVTGLPVAATVLPASVHDNDATEAVLDEVHQWGSAERLEHVLVDRGVTEKGGPSHRRRCRRRSAPGGLRGVSRLPTVGSAGLGACP